MVNESQKQHKATQSYEIANWLLLSSRQFASFFPDHNLSNLKCLPDPKHLWQMQDGAKCLMPYTNRAGSPYVIGTRWMPSMEGRNCSCDENSTRHTALGELLNLPVSPRFFFGNLLPDLVFQVIWWCESKQVLKIKGTTRWNQRRNQEFWISKVCFSLKLFIFCSY